MPVDLSAMNQLLGGKKRKEVGSSSQLVRKKRVVPPEENVPAGGSLTPVGPSGHTSLPPRPVDNVPPPPSRTEPAEKRFAPDLGLGPEDSFLASPTRAQLAGRAVVTPFDRREAKKNDRQKLIGIVLTGAMRACAAVIGLEGQLEDADRAVEAETRVKENAIKLMSTAQGELDREKAGRAQDHVASEEMLQLKETELLDKEAELKAAAAREADLKKELVEAREKAASEFKASEEYRMDLAEYALAAYLQCLGDMAKVQREAGMEAAAKLLEDRKAEVQAQQRDDGSGSQATVAVEGQDNPEESALPENQE